MYNVFSYVLASSNGVNDRTIRSAQGCCLLRISHGIYAVVDECEHDDHAVFRQWVDAPGDLGKPPDRTAEFRRIVTQHLGLIAVRGSLEEELFLSHRSAAAARRIPLADTSFDRIETSGPAARRQTTSVRRYRRRTVPEEYVHADCADLPGYRMTTDIWTVADLLRDGTELDAFVAADAYIGGIANATLGILVANPRNHRRTTSAENLAKQRDIRKGRLACVLDELEKQNSHRGMARARRLLDLTTGMAESPLESLTLLALIRLGVTGIEQQVEFPRPDQSDRFDRVDFYIPHLNLIIEADGWSKYEEFGPRIQEGFRRDRRLARHGKILHVEWKEVMPQRDGYGLAVTLHDLGIHV